MRLMNSEGLAHHFIILFVFVFVFLYPLSYQSLKEQELSFFKLKSSMVSIVTGTQQGFRCYLSNNSGISFPVPGPLNKGVTLTNHTFVVSQSLNLFPFTCGQIFKVQKEPPAFRRLPKTSWTMALSFSVRFTALLILTASFKNTQGQLFGFL